MQRLNFDLQRFATQEISAGDIYERDGVIFTAITDAILNLDDDGKISGLASGKVQSTIAGAENSPTITFDSSDGAIKFSATENDALAVTLSGRTFYFTEGTATVTGDKVSTGATKFSIAGTYSNADYKFTVEDSAEFSITTEAFVISSEKFYVSVLIGGNTLEFGVSGTATRNFTNHTFSFSGGTTISNNFGDYTFSATANDDSGGGFSFTSKGITFTPENGGTLGISIAQGDTPIFAREFSVNGGSIFVNHANQTIGLTDGAEISLASGDYEIIAKANGDASTVFSFADNGFTFTPNTGDGTLDFTIKNSSSSMSANVEILSGSFTFGENGALTVEKGTELQIKFSDDYIVNIKATDDAGGTIFLGTDGITFAPNSGDGSLDISITRNGETRTANLNMTGSLTYKLDGSISWTQGTVIKSFFDDDSSLTITANKNADAKMIFSPQDGLSITPSVPDALSVLLSAEGTDIIKLAEIDGTVTYSGGTFTASDGTEIRFVDPAGIYNDNVLRTAGGSTSLNFNTERIIYTANEGATFTMDYLQGTTWELQNGSITDYYNGAIQGLLSLSKGSTFDTNDSEYPFTLEKEGNYMLNGMKVTNSDSVDVLFSNYETLTVDGISYTPLDENVALTTDNNVTTVSGGKVSMEMDGFGRSFTFDVTDGTISYDGTTGKFSVTAGAKTLFSNEALPDQFVAKNDFDITVKKNSDGTFTFSTDDPINFAIERNGNAILQTTLTVDGSIEFNPSTHEISLTKDTVLTMTPGTGRTLQITALDDAGSTLNLVDGGIRFAPNANDGALEFNFVESGRKMTLDVTGAFTYGGLGKFSLEDGTEINIAWEDGNQIKLTSHGSTGSIGIDPERGLKITSDDENLDMTFSTPSMSTDISGIKGTIYYNAGIVSFDENSKITATTTLGGQPILTTLEAIDGTGHISFNTTNGVIYAADTGALRVTWSRGDLESTFTVNEGSVQIGHNLFQIAEGSDLATDLKNFVPAFYFTTGEAGTYTINGQTITTSAANLALTATDDYMTFKTSNNVVEYDGMTFAGNGNVSLSPASVILGAGVEANGFGEGNSFVLAEEGTVSADEKIFQLDSLSLDDGREIPMIISVTGAQDGFIFSRTLTEESEEFLGYLDSPYVGSIFTEKFIAKGDNSYRVRTDPIGLEDVIGISDGASISGGATLDDEETLSYYVLVTDTTGKFTIGEKTYTIADGSELGTEIRARFDVDSAPYADKITDLNGTISGDFTEGQFSVNGSAGMQIFDDTDISIVADANNVEIFGLDAGASLKVSEAGNYVVNSTSIAAQANDVIVGINDTSAAIFGNETVTSHETDDILKNTVGFNVENLETVEITDSESIDAAISDDTKILTVSDGVKDVNLSNSDYPQVVSLTGGNQNVEFNNLDGNAAIVDENATGWKNITFGDGDDVGIFKSSHTVNKVSLSAGNDSIFVDNGAKVRVDMKNADAAKIIPWSGKITLENYDASTGAGFVTDYTDILAAVDDGKIYFDKGQMSVGSAVVNFNGTTGDVVNFFDASERLQKVGIASPHESLDLSKENSNFILVADKNSTLAGGTGDDTIFAYEGSLVDAGAGKNSIYIEDRDENSSGTKIGLDNGGNTTVHNFKTGFDDDSDAIYSDGGLEIRLRLYDENLVASVNGGAQVTLEGVADDDFAEILLAMPDSTTKVAVAKAGGVIKSPDAQIYLGNSEYKGGGVDFSGTTENLFVNLSDEPVVTDAGEKQFYGINYVAAGDGVSTLIGSSDNDTFIAGNGYGSLWGGAGDDNLIGKADSENKDGRTSFFFFAGDGNDTVSNFEFLTRENKISGNADKIAIISDIVTRGRISGDNVVLQLNDGEDFLTIEDARGKNFSLNEYNVKIDKNISYDGFANCYVADGGSSLTVDSSVDSAEIWLDSSHGTLFFGNIRTLDASSVEGRTSLAGYALDETIIAGKGDSSLWGGIFGDDLLIGGESQNTFFYHLGEGNDTIQGAKSGDIVDLNTLTIDQVVGEIGDGFVVLKFNDGGTLTVTGTDVEFRINNDGTTYVVDNGEWKIK